MHVSAAATWEDAWWFTEPEQSTTLRLARRMRLLTTRLGVLLLEGLDIEAALRRGADLAAADDRSEEQKTRHSGGPLSQLLEAGGSAPRAQSKRDALRPVTATWQRSPWSDQSGLGSSRACSGATLQAVGVALRTLTVRRALRRDTVATRWPRAAVRPSLSIDAAEYRAHVGLDRVLPDIMT